MAKFDDLTITNNGLDMIALSQSGAKLIFTKIKLGDGQIGDNDVMKLTDIINERMTSQISSIEAKGEGQVAIKFTVDNSELTSGFFVREIGIFAKINEGGEEKLYAYTNAGNYTNYLADNKTPIDAIITKIDLAIGNATDINFTVDKSIIYVSLEDLETNLQKHNSNIDSHTEAFTKHNDDENAHDNLIKKLFDLSEVTLESIKSKIKDWSKEVCLPLSGGTMKGNINANGYNITATKFIGNLQGKADSAANADLATKANQDSQGQTINTTYVKGVTASNATLTVTKGNGTTSTVTINNVENSKKATQDGSGNTITTHYLSRNQSTQNDMNACTVEGIYRFSGTLKNGWTSDSWGTLLVFNNQYNGSSGVSGTYLVQIALPTDGRMWTRQRVNTGAWTSWNKLANTTDCTDTLKKVYPVGSIYMSTVSTNPATLFGFGTWEAMPAGRVLLAQGKSSWGTTYNAGSTGGEATHQLTVGELPSHNHTATISTTNLTGWFTNNGNSDTANSDGTIFKASKRTGQGSSSGGAADGGKFTFNGAHAHTITINNSGSNQSHNNIQPYISVYMWKRSA
ncbi:hypothetical protein E0L01_09095 [Megamonas funiformis]|uniref:phage baseplate protein n=1 Tax=Megamonas funiformis TaxID=437897 RepID=UPI0014314CA0|nr:hypothetical protein [Megamonas funiformis]NJE28926.1 hypothetical protein [Megamonas funiformis]